MWSEIESPPLSLTGARFGCLEFQKMTDHRKSIEPELEIQYFDKNVLWIGASGASSFSEGETMAQGLILEYHSAGHAVGVVLTRSALDKLKDFLDPGNAERNEALKKVSD